MGTQWMEKCELEGVWRQAGEGQVMNPLNWATPGFCPGVQGSHRRVIGRSRKKTNNLIKKWAEDLNRHFIGDAHGIHEKMLNAFSCQGDKCKLSLSEIPTPTHLSG